MATVIISLHCLPESFEFEAKRISLPPDSRVLLGSVTTDCHRDPKRTATPTNGFFPGKSLPTKCKESIMPLGLSACHAEIWLNGNQVMVRDLDAPFGTFINGVKLVGETVLKSGDVIALGYKLPRNDRTPAHITDDHLKPIAAKVTVSVESHA
ncbi:hypothetical protein AX15_006592 [Amanita polypyramis BW_CC]|nr:hypothetical protein AX15_006592 [Amanita polypyramis BW_CC]